MNIKDAKTEIINTLRAYHRKDEKGNYLYPRVRQRPILLIGPPGIGKTAIMEQVARECQVGLVSYTITHHTRQSAIGLPHIETKIFGGQELTVTEYTMSEIIASVYACMEKTGKKEGILFIDEINCVSETLAPTMLQFLQNKTFGSHRVPDGWLIVAAGNPAEYNKSVREFDIVTLDRVRKIEIRENLEVWEEYARERQIHGAVLSYLSIKKDHFYQVDNRAEEKAFVTARGWEDLSEILKSYEELSISANWELIYEFLQKEEIARDFAAYYQLFCQYGQDYQIRELLEGTLCEAELEKRLEMMKRAGFDECMAVTGYLTEALLTEFRQFAGEEEALVKLHEHLKALKGFLKGKTDIQEGCEEFYQEKLRSLKVKEDSELLTIEETDLEYQVLDWLKEYMDTLRSHYLHETEQGFAFLAEQFDQQVEIRKQKIQVLTNKVDRAFSFLEQACPDGQELVFLVSALSRNTPARKFLSVHFCEKYLEYSKKLLYREREKELQKACMDLLTYSSQPS